MIGVFVTFWRHRQAKSALNGLQEPIQDKLIGRRQDLAVLDQAWRDESANLFLLNALGGSGKTSLLQAWLNTLERDGWREADKVYGWSFPDVTDDVDVQALTDEFIGHALDWFACDLKIPTHPLERVNFLCKLIQRHRTLLVLDNFPSFELEIEGEHNAQNAHPLGVLLNSLAAYNPGLCVIAAREPLPVSEIFQQHIIQYALPELGMDAGADLLRQRGVMLPSAILRKLSHDFCGHPLTLDLLGSYLGNGGELADVNAILAWRDKEREGLQTRRALAILENWLWQTPELLLLYLVSLLDRPATQKDLYLLLHSQRQAWFQRWLRPDETLQALAPLSKLSLREFSRVQRHLYKLRLISSAPDTGALEMHALLRTYFRERIRRFPGIPERLQPVLEKCTQTLSAILPPAAPVLPGAGVERRLGFADMQAAIKATRSLGVKLEKSALQKHWYRASIIANHLCEHHLILGNLSAAMYCARRGVAYAELSRDQPSLLQNMKLLTRLLRLTGGTREAAFLLQRTRTVCGKETSAPQLTAQAC
ncbi:MAG: ATP-binding protein [Candidatus Thiothrix singaporensis]|uniref:ATP-binding protein n=1 Tax=Candidatus Thiothrix singaporensis TaxID=2799669 RepID=A0A7L6AWH1_9GAMM|nr:MAG: ATP-binding protein [Candidatus Thiothrix singaporensis]